MLVPVNDKPKQHWFLLIAYEPPVNSAENPAKGIDKQMLDLCAQLVHPSPRQGFRFNRVAQAPDLGVGLMG